MTFYNAKDIGGGTQSAPIPIYTDSGQPIYINVHNHKRGGGVVSKLLQGIGVVAIGMLAYREFYDVLPSPITSFIDDGYSKITMMLGSDVVGVPKGFPMPGITTISSGFGMRMHPVLKINRMHEGMDFPAPIGTPVQSTADGTVIYAGEQTGYGNIVIIDHSGFKTKYAHLSVLRVGNTQDVKAGQVIGLSGNSGGIKTGAHLHYEVLKNEQAVNPNDYL